jgi:transcriptional regulator with XRE-family HTH domain
MMALPRRNRTFADKINFLFATVRPPGEDREYTNSEVASATDISGSYVGYLRKGIRDNPSIEAVRALARFFGVPASYLVDDEHDEQRLAGIEAQLKLVQALKHPGIKQLAMRAADAGLSPTGLQTIAAMIDEVRKLEQAARKPPRRTGA